MPAARKGGQSGFQYHNTKKDTPSQNVPILHRYVEYNSTSLGGIATASSHIITERSEIIIENTEASEQMNVDVNHNAGADGHSQHTNNQDDEDLDEPPVDQAYIQCMQEEGELEEEVLKRIRPKGVC